MTLCSNFADSISTAFKDRSQRDSMEREGNTNIPPAAEISHEPFEKDFLPGVKTSPSMTLRTKLLVVCLVLASLGIPALTTASASETPESASSDLHPDIDVDDVLLRVNLQENGTANWRVEYRVQLDDENVTDAFKQLEADIKANESTYRERFATRMRNTVRTAENTTGREMTARRFTVTTDRRQLPQEYGIIVYTFQWDGFAETTESSIRAGDALAGLFLDSETTLLISWPSGYTSTTASPDPSETRERTIVWTGPLDFGSGEPNLVLSPTEVTTSQSSPSTTGETTTASGRESNGTGLPMPFIAGVLLLVFVLGGAVFAVRGRGKATVPETPITNEEPNTTADPADELMSNEERVLTLLEERGGRVKQQTIVEELDWTGAKASRVVNRLKDDEKVEVFRLGRENVVTLPDEGGT
ncbi:helix-turn-helix transcriptional regulator [Halorussus sp. AFM4]|uniref:helix-turn-helix transcriptional regulator n=1 Tax=Halorussus sp. AFM4 TaxID=3421651 RepID=UPI003EBC825E